MNKERRKSIDVTMEQLKGALEAFNSVEVEQPKFDTETIRDEEQEYFDAMPEGLQAGEKGQTAEEAISQLTEAYDALDEAEGYLADLKAAVETALEKLEEAKG